MTKPVCPAKTQALNQVRPEFLLHCQWIATGSFIKLTLRLDLADAQSLSVFVGSTVSFVGLGTGHITVGSAHRFNISNYM